MGELVLSLRLLGGFELTVDGQVVTLPAPAEHVIAFLALQDRAVLRPFVAGHLWPEVTDARAQANLRCALWRLHANAPQVVHKRAGKLILAPSVSVDVRDATTQANALLAGSEESLADVSALSSELLPDWYEDWVAQQRERLRELYLHALDELAQRQISTGRHAAAVTAALAAVQGEPLRESVRRTLMRAHLAEGNAADAIRQYLTFRHLLRSELGIEPGPRIAALFEAASGAGLQDGPGADGAAS